MTAKEYNTAKTCLILKAMRKELRLRQLDLWAGSGITPDRLSRFENLRSTPNSVEIRSLIFFLARRWSMKVFGYETTLVPAHVIIGHALIGKSFRWDYFKPRATNVFGKYWAGINSNGGWLLFDTLPEAIEYAVTSGPLPEHPYRDIVPVSMAIQ